MTALGLLLAVSVTVKNGKFVIAPPGMAVIIR